jgi:hypothetical protein
MNSPIPRYTFLAFEINALLDLGLSASVEDVLNRLDDGTIIDWLATTFEGKVDLSLYGAAERETMAEELVQMTAANARKKFGVERNGLCLLVAYCLQILQQGGFEES